MSSIGNVISLGASSLMMFNTTVTPPLPPDSMPYEEFVGKFQLGSASTEKLHPVTRELSAVFHQDPIKGLELLCKVEEDVIKSVDDNLSVIVNTVLVPCKESLSKGGRIFFVGSGSSGRIAIDLAAKSKAKFPEKGEQIYDVIAGGDSALVRAKEGFEDSDKDGLKAMQDLKIASNDVVFLISGSGSASFNVGAGHYAAEAGAKVFYFYNSTEVPERTKGLFERMNNPVAPLLVDTGPQAIAGSTRLQAATIGEIFLGTILEETLKEMPDTEIYKEHLKTGLNLVLKKIREQLSAINRIVQAEHRVFSSPTANFYRLQDSTDQGYVTLVAMLETIRNGFKDLTETSPTFSTNPTRREVDILLKREEFRAFLLGQWSNKVAWEIILGRPLHQEDEKEAFQFLISSQAEGLNSFANRPLGKGNLVMAAIQVKESEPLPSHILQVLHKAKENGAETAVIIICEKQLSKEQEESLDDCCDHPVFLENIPQDHFGLLHSVALKWTLNLISNGAMISMNKVLGNRMIDVQASNNKLIDRAIRLISEIWQEAFPEQVCDYEALYYYVLHVRAKHKALQEKGQYVPSVVKIILTMLYHKKTLEGFDEIVELLLNNQERMEFLERIKT